MTIKHIKIIFGIIALFAFIFFVLYIYDTDRKAHTKFIEKSFSGILTDIRYLENGSGFPDIRIDSSWIYLGIRGGKANNYIKISDSIVKNSGTEKIKVYRKTMKEVGTKRYSSKIIDVA